MKIRLSATVLVRLALAVAKKRGHKVGKEYCAGHLAKKLFVCLGYKQPKKSNKTLIYQGFLLNYIQNNGRIVPPIHPLSVAEHPEVEVPDWIARENISSASPIKHRTKPQNKKLPKWLVDETGGYSRNNAETLYKSEEWRALRYEVLREQGGICQLCGRSRKDGVILHVDHIIPLSKDWSRRLDKNNLQVLCEDCNLGKSNTDEIDWR